MTTFGKNLDVEAQDMAYSIYTFFKKRSEDPFMKEYIPHDTKLLPTVAKATGLPEKIIEKIVKKRESQLQDHSALTMTHIVLDNIGKCEVKRRVLQFYSQYKKAPTLTEINNTFKEKHVLISTSNYLEKLLKEIGFKYHKLECPSELQILVERQSLVITRKDYLKKITKYRDSGRKIVFLGETYISVAQKAEDKLEVKQNNKEGGLILLHACDSQGFLKGTLVIIETKMAHKCYLNDMNFAIFAWWLNEKLLPNLPPQSVIVMRNNSYNLNADKPTYISTKKEFEVWFTKNKISFTENLNKRDMLELVNNHQSSGDSRLEQMIKENGHDVLRIPAAHADLNPIEWIWRNVKNQLWTSEQQNLSLTMKEQTIEQLLVDYSITEWQQCHNQVQILEHEYHENDAKLDKTTKEMLEALERNEEEGQQIKIDEALSDSQEEMEISD